MDERTEDTRADSLWHATARIGGHSRLTGDVEADVAIVGGGITGLTAAVILARAGRRVALLEARTLGSGETGQTTAHATAMIDHRWSRIVEAFGKDDARLAADSQMRAIERIAAFVVEERIECGFERVPGYLYAETRDGVSFVEDEAEAARSLGLPVAVTSDLPLPIRAERVARIEEQAEFHPIAYLAALARAAARSGRLFEGSRVTEIEDGEPCRVRTETGSVTARDVLVATNVPLNRVFLHTKIASYRTYAIAFRGQAPPPRGLFWDDAEPYHYTRGQQVGDDIHWIVGGEDHKVGHPPEGDPYERLGSFVRERFGPAAITHRWSGQVVEPADGLPFIGRNSLSSHVYVATGYSGNGITNGTIAALVVSDEILGHENPWAPLYDARRMKPLAAAKSVITETADVAAHFVTDRFRSADSIDELPVGEGRIVDRGGERLAVYRDPDGHLESLSPVCPHLGCYVAWNDIEKSWDCPCHGSRFDPRGNVLHGPSVTPLKRK